MVKKEYQILLATALIAVGSVILIPMPYPFLTLMPAPTIIFVTGILLGSAPALVSSAIGTAVGYMAAYNMGLFSISPSFLVIDLLEGVIARTSMGFVVGSLRKVNELVAMIAGVIVEIATLFILHGYVFAVGPALSSLGLCIDLVHIPIAYAVIRGMRKMLKVTYLE